MDTNFKKKIKVAIRKGRLGKDLTQKELAEKMEVVQSAVSAWESGTRVPTGDDLLKLCEVLDMKEYLFGEVDINYLKSRDLEEIIKDEIAELREDLIKGEITQMRQEMVGRIKLLQEDHDNKIEQLQKDIAKLTNKEKTVTEIPIEKDTGKILSNVVEKKRKTNEFEEDDEDSTSKDFAELIKGQKKQREEKIEKAKKGPGVKKS